MSEAQSSATAPNPYLESLPERLRCMAIWEHFSEKAKLAVCSTDWYSTYNSTDVGGKPYARANVDVDIEYQGKKLVRKDASVCPLGLAIIIDRLNIEQWVGTDPVDGSLYLSLATVPGAGDVADVIDAEYVVLLRAENGVLASDLTGREYEAWQTKFNVAVRKREKIRSEASVFINDWDAGRIPAIDAALRVVTCLDKETQPNGEPASASSDDQPAAENETASSGVR